MFCLLHQAVDHHAASHPDAVAFLDGKSELSYGDLASQTDAIATALKSQGVEPGDRVGLLMPRCVETAVGVYGILKAGAIFVALDPLLRGKALQRLIEDAGIQHLITLPAKSDVVNELLRLGTPLKGVFGLEPQQPFAGASHPWEALNDFQRSDQPALSPDAPAYIMYSSGSTGHPKGITHTHRSGLAYARLSTHTYGVTAADVIANHSPVNFDMSTFGYFASVYAGAKTLIIPEAYTKVPASLAKLAEKQRVTIWYSVPLALIQLLLRAPLDDLDLSSIRWIKYGGEPFPPKHLKSLMRKIPSARVSNVYGPAEVNQCTFYHVPEDFAGSAANDPVPIGRVWNETHGILLDENDEPIADGTPGELLISSPTMMQGYWGRDNDHAPYIRTFEIDGTPLTYYRTGDIVTRREDGHLVFVGRKDRQVKIRGYRIELDEIEHALSYHEDVVESGVYFVQQEDAKQVRAAVIMKPESEFNFDELRQHLETTISPYAVPSIIDAVTELPRTTSGKVDRNALRIRAEAVGN